MNKYFNIDCVYLMLQYSVKQHSESTETDLCTDKRLCTSAVDSWREQSHSRVKPVHNCSGFKGDVNRIKDTEEWSGASAAVFLFSNMFFKAFLHLWEKNGLESGLIMRRYQKCVAAAEDGEIRAATTVTAVHIAVWNTQKEAGRAQNQAPRRCF